MSTRRSRRNKPHEIVEAPSSGSTDPIDSISSRLRSATAIRNPISQNIPEVNPSRAASDVWRKQSDEEIASFITIVQSENDWSSCKTAAISAAKIIIESKVRKDKQYEELLRRNDALRAANSELELTVKTLEFRMAVRVEITDWESDLFPRWLFTFHFFTRRLKWLFSIVYRLTNAATKLSADLERVPIEPDVFAHLVSQIHDEESVKIHQSGMSSNLSEELLNKITNKLNITGKKLSVVKFLLRGPPSNRAGEADAGAQASTSSSPSAACENYILIYVKRFVQDRNTKEPDIIKAMHNLCNEYRDRIAETNFHRDKSNYFDLSGSMLLLGVERRDLDTVKAILADHKLQNPSLYYDAGFGSRPRRPTAPTRRA